MRFFHQTFIVKKSIQNFKFYSTKLDSSALIAEIDKFTNKLSIYTNVEHLQNNDLPIKEKLEKFKVLLLSLEKSLSSNKEYLSNSLLSLQEFEKSIFLDCKRVSSNFRSEDLKEFDKSFFDVKANLKNFFDKVGVFSIIWKGGDFSDEVNLRLNHQNILEPKYSMYYAAGRFNEAKLNLFEKTKIKLESLNLMDKNSSNIIVKELSNFNPNEMDNLNPKTFKFEIKNNSDSEKENYNLELNLNLLKNNMDNLVWQSVLLQSSIWGVGLIATYFGAVWTTVVPTTLVVSGIGFGWIKLKFNGYKEKLLSLLSIRHQTIRANLILTYEKEFDRILKNPLIKILELGESKFTEELNLVKKHEEELEGLKAELSSFEKKI